MLNHLILVEIQYNLIDYKSYRNRNRDLKWHKNYFLKNIKGSGKVDCVNFLHLAGLFPSGE